VALLSLGWLLFVFFTRLVRLFLAAVGELTLVTGLIRLILSPVGLIPKVLLRLASLILLFLWVHL
jgi:hypothetical protein